MNRRRFLQNMGAATAGMNGFTGLAETMEPPTLSSDVESSGLLSAGAVHVEGHTLLCTFQRGSETWKVYEDLRTREGVMTFVTADGSGRVLSKSAEAAFADANPPYLGLNLREIALAGPDLLADRLLQNGDPDPEQVRRAAPPMGSAEPEPHGRIGWETILGTKECQDTMPLYPSGSTRTYHPVQFISELNVTLAKKRFDGLLGGWMPAVRKVMPVSAAEYYEVLALGDVLAKDKFIVQTWHRTARIANGQIVEVEYGYSYPPFPPRRESPAPEAFYRGLLEFCLYWENVTRDVASAALPDSSWVDMARYAFVKEQIVRPGGVYPKYGAVDRDYYGPEYDGFQDIFTSSLYSNLEWGRFDMARRVFDNYYSEFVDPSGMVNMRGPETAQFGLALSLIARYCHYTGDRALPLKHREKIESTAALLTELHDESLRLSPEMAGYGLIHGWNESDSCLMPKPMTWWQPYFANSAMAARGLRDIALVWEALGSSDPRMNGLAESWRRHSQQLKETVATSVRKNVRHDMNPRYIGPLPGAKLTFRESMAQEHPSPQLWPHRAYAELLHADILPADLAHCTIDCMRAYGATTLGVVANVGRPDPEDRAILGFISYGYALALLRLDRIEEYLLFLYAHRFHDHTRGSWTAGEVAGIAGGTAIFCIPAQLTIPMLVRWMMVFEDSDEDRLYFGKGLPREWVVSGKEIRIDQAPTRWGRVNFRMIADAIDRVTATIALAADRRPPKEIQVTFRLPTGYKLRSVVANGRPVEVGEIHRDTVLLVPGNTRHFEIFANFTHV
jgi:hypothetical protein